MRLRLEPDDLRSLLTTLPTDRTTRAMLLVAARADRPDLRGVDVARAVKAAEIVGEVETSRHPEVDDLLVCLTPLGAERAGVVLNRDSTLWEPVSGPADFRYRVPSDLLDDDGLAWLEPDRTYLDPLDRLISMEEGDELDAHSPKHLVALGTSSPLPFYGDRCYLPIGCPVHPGRRPGPRFYCIYCDSTHEIVRPKPVRPRRPRVARVRIEETRGRP